MTSSRSSANLATRLRPVLVTEDEIVGSQLSCGSHLLGVVGFDAARPTTLASACPFVRVNMARLDHAPAFEAWITPEAVQWGMDGKSSFGLAGDLMFGVLGFEEAEFAGIRDFAYASYKELFALAERAGRPNILRVANYLPRITQRENGEERYRLFNTGRHAAFNECGRPVAMAPAACALGTRGGTAAIAFIASVCAGQPVENPRQVSAYRYPERYGPHSPSFSRAMLFGQPSQLFVSGTASIVGHETLHIGDAGAQTREALQNIKAILGNCDTSWEEVAGETSLKIYVRDATDLALVKEQLPDCANRLILEAEICRPDLLSEVEAFCASLPDANRRRG